MEKGAPSWNSVCLGIAHSEVRMEWNEFRAKMKFDGIAITGLAFSIFFKKSQNQ
jgi:hypothetical protein